MHSQRVNLTTLVASLALAGLLGACGEGVLYSDEEEQPASRSTYAASDAGVDADAEAGAGPGSSGTSLAGAAVVGGMAIAFGPCRAFCAATYPASSPIPFVTAPYDQCVNVCRLAARVGCNGLWERCAWLAELARTGSAAMGAKKAVEMCLTVYNVMACH